MQINKENLRLNGDEPRRGIREQIIIQVRKMQFKDWIHLLLLGLSFIPGKVWKFFNRHIWVVSEYEKLARDNGYWFFKYCRDNYPDKSVYYPISYQAADRAKIDVLGNRVRFSSFKHFLLFWSAEKQFTSSKNAGFPSRICEELVQWKFHRFQYIMLNHGITKGKSTVVDVTKTNYDYICTCSEMDKRIIVLDNGQPDEKVLPIGFARHDNLDNSILNKNVLLIMPTWRSWINYKRARTKKDVERTIGEFLKSDYYARYNSLLNNETFIRFIEKNNLTVFFYLHDYAQFYADWFKSESDNIIIAKSEKYDIQTLLKMAALLVTDYSSVCYDFAYMYKPVLYYQFDIKEFEYYQYQAGDQYTYEDDGMGEIFNEENDLIKEIMNYYFTGCLMPEKYKNRVEAFFSHHDKKNCERIFNMFNK